MREVAGSSEISMMRRGHHQPSPTITSPKYFPWRLSLLCSAQHQTSDQASTSWSQLSSSNDLCSKYKYLSYTMLHCQHQALFHKKLFNSCVCSMLVLSRGNDNWQKYIIQCFNLMDRKNLNIVCLWLMTWYLQTLRHGFKIAKIMLVTMNKAEMKLENIIAKLFAQQCGAVAAHIPEPGSSLQSSPEQC